MYCNLLNILLFYSMAEGVEGSTEICDVTKVKTEDNDHIWKIPMDERIGILLNNDLMSDIKFTVNGKRFHAHKFVLSYASEVFYAMFNGPLADGSEEIDIVDCENPEDFLEFLSIIYKKSAKITWENVEQLSYLRKKYMIVETGPFSNFVKSIVDTENCLDALDTSVKLEEDDMIEECLNVIRRDISVLVNTERFLKLKQPSLKVILKQDKLNIKEIDLFNAVDRWCSDQVDSQKASGNVTKKRDVLGDALYCIRFPSIKLQAFISFCRPSKILTNKEIVDLYDILLLDPKLLGSTSLRKSYDEDDGIINENESDTATLPAKFISIPRVKGNTIIRIIDNEKFYSHSVPHVLSFNRLTIMVNRKAWLVGLKILGPWKEAITAASDTYTLKHISSEDKLARLDTPLCIEPNKECEIHCGNGFLSSIGRLRSQSPRMSYSRMPYSSTDRVPIKYKWNGFECTVTQPSVDYVSTISQLIFSTFDGTAMDRVFPMLNMTATLHD